MATSDLIGLRLSWWCLCNSRVHPEFCAYSVPTTQKPLGLKTESYYAAQAGLKFSMHLSLPSTYWDYRSVFMPGHSSVFLSNTHFFLTRKENSLLFSQMRRHGCHCHYIIDYTRDQKQNFVLHLIKEEVVLPTKNLETGSWQEYFSIRQSNSRALGELKVTFLGP